MRTKTLLLILLWTTLPLSLFAATMEESLDEAARYFTGTDVRVQPSHQIVIDVTNFRSGQKDSLSQKIEAELYMALEKHFPQFKLILLSESLTGISSRAAVLVKGTYEPTGNDIKLRLVAVKGLSNGEILAQTSVFFESKLNKRRTLVAILDIEASDLSKKQRKAFSEVFRSKLIRKNAFEVASSADIDKMNPDAIQQKLNCTRDECATIIGEQLGVDRVISSNVFQLGATSWILSGKMINIQDGSISTSATVNHQGGLGNFDQALDQLASKLVGSSGPQPSYAPPPVTNKKKGDLFISTKPQGATITIDGRTLPQKSDYYLKGIDEGSHQIKMIKGSVGAIEKVRVRANQINRIEAVLKPLKSNLKIVSNPFNARVYIDGIYKGKTPLSISMDSGRHRLKISSSGFMDYKKQLVVKPLTNQNVDIKLEKPPTLKISSNPAGASVYLNGMYKGRSPMSFTANPGRYNIKLTKRGYDDVSGSYLVKTGRENHFEASLTPFYDLKVSVSPSDSEVRLKGGSLSRSFGGTGDAQNYSATLKRGEYVLVVRHPHSVKNYESTVNLNHDVTKNVKLDLDPEYLRRLEHEGEVLKWRFKVAGALALNLVPLAYTYGEYQKMNEAQSELDGFKTQMNNAEYYHQSLVYYEQAQDQQKVVEQHQQSTLVGTVLTGAALWFTWWVYDDKPSLGGSAMILPKIENTENFQLTFVKQW